MSRSGDQYLFEIAAAGKYFAAWVCDDQNLPILAATINSAAAEYEKQRTDRVYLCGVPVVETAPTNFTSTAATTNRSGEATATSRSFADDAEDEESLTLSSVPPVVAEKVSQAVYSAASTARYWARFLCAKVMDSALSNSLEKFRETFPRVDATNAQIAFLYIGQLSNGWAVEHHNGIGRASLSTLILTAVLDEFVKLSTSPRGVLSDLTKEVEDTESVFVEVDWKTVPTKGGEGKVDPDLPHLARFLTCYTAKEGIDPLRRSEQAKQIFLAFAGTEKAKRLSIPLRNHTTMRVKQLEMVGSAAATPKR